MTGALHYIPLHFICRMQGVLLSVTDVNLCEIYVNMVVINSTYIID